MRPSVHERIDLEPHHDHGTADDSRHQHLMALDDQLRMNATLGGVPERLKGPVLKTGVALVVTVGSNPTPTVRRGAKTEERGGKREEGVFSIQCLGGLNPFFLRYGSNWKTPTEVRKTIGQGEWRPRITSGRAERWEP